MPFDDVQHGLLLVGSEQAFAFAAAVVRPLPEVGYQADDDASALIVGQIVQYIHESFGIAHFPAGTEKGQSPFMVASRLGLIMLQQSFSAGMLSTDNWRRQPSAWGHRSLRHKG